MLREDESFIRVLASEALNPRADSYGLILTHLGEFIGMIERVLDRGIENGEIRKDKPPAQLALVFLGYLTLLFNQHWNSGGTCPSLDEIPDLVVTLFVDGAGNAGHIPISGERK